MKALPLTTALVLVFAGGIAAGRWIWPATTQAKTEAADAGGTAGGGKVAIKKSETHAPLPAFDGTLERLRAIAKAARSPSRASRHLSAALDPAGAAQVAALMAAFPWKASLPWEESTVYSTLLEAWTEKDADAALRWAGTLPLHRQRGVRSSIFSTLGQVDLPKAMGLLGSVKNVAERHGLQRSLANELARTDPQAALRLISETGPSGRHYTSSIFSQWAERDPQAAWAAAQAQPTAHRPSCLQSVLSTWALTDPAAAQASAASLPPGSRRVYALGTVFGSWATNAPAAAMAAASALGNAAERKSAMRAAINSWANTDPAAALKAADSIGSHSERSQLQVGVLNTWAQNDSQAAVAAVGNLELKRNNRANFLQNVASQWGQSDPQAALTWARSLPERDARYLIGDLLGNISGNDPAAATAAWKSLPRPQQRNALWGMMQSWAGQDMDGALAFARGLENPQDRNNAIQNCVGALTFEEPGKIAAIFEHLPAGPTRVSAMRQFVMNRSQQGDGEAATAWMRTLPEKERAAVFSGFGDYGWSPQGPEAKEWAALIKDTPGAANQNFLQRVASAMAGEDPAAAVEWAGSLEDTGHRKAVLQSALSQWAQDQPSDAMSAAQALPEGQSRTEAMQSIIQTWSYHDPDALLAWAATATGAERENALITGGLVKADYDPEAGAKIVEQFLRPQNGEKTSAAMNSAAAQVASGWFSQDMEKGVAWVSALPESDARGSAVSSVVRQWTGLDPVAASEWVSQLPAGDSRDAGAATLSSSIRQTDPERALAWAGSIASPTRREEALMQTLESWRYQDKEAARAAAEKAVLSDTARDAILEKIDKQ